MYYNIKIKSNGSEFSLESNNKEITQREMDMYFACIFDVSDEFKSNIKKIEIKNSNLKSIKEIENYANNNALNNIQTTQKQIKDFTEQKNIQVQQPKPIEKMSIEQKIIEQRPIEPKVIEPKPVEQRPIAQMPIEQELYKNSLQEEKLINEFQQKELQQPQAPIPNQVKFEELKSTDSNVIKETLAPFNKPSEIKFENASQIQYNRGQNSNYDDLSIKDFDLKLEEMPFEDINAVENNDFINQEQEINQINFQKSLKPIEQPNFEPLVKEPMQTPMQPQVQTPIQPTQSLTQPMQPQMQSMQPIQTPTFQPEEKEIDFSDNDVNEINEKPQYSEIDELISLAQDKINSFDINDDLINSDLNLKNFENQKNEMQFDNNLQQVHLNEEKLNDIFANNDTAHQNSQSSMMDTIEHQQNYQQASNNQNQTNFNQQVQEMPQGAYQQDFKLYLSEFNYENTAEIFLICAFYIKNILQQENFTMKFINSKLFQATGRIADMRVLDDLISKEYIRVIDSLEFKKYSITQDGEGYFTRRFQG